MSSSKTAIVVGGSLGGLFTGIVLKRLGHRVTIFERSSTPILQDQGAGIVAGGDVLQFLQQFDKTRREVAVVSRVRHHLNKDGKEYDRHEWEQKMTSWDLLYHVLRANFDGVESKYVTPPKDDEGDVKYEYGTAVNGIELDEETGEMVVSYKDRNKQECEARAARVFAADGPSSAIRQILLPEDKRIYAGYVHPLVKANLMEGCLARNCSGIKTIEFSKRCLCREIHILRYSRTSKSSNSSSNARY